MNPFVIQSAVFASGAESAYLGTLGMRALAGDLGAALTATALAEAAANDSWSQAPTVTPSAEAAVADVRRFAPSVADFCDCFRQPTALEKLHARFVDPHREYSDEEKLKFAKAMFDAMDEIFAEAQRRVREIVEGRGDLEALEVWGRSQKEWFCKVDRQLRLTSAGIYKLINAFSSSYTQPVTLLDDLALNIREIMFFDRTPLSTSRFIEAFLAERKPRLLGGTKGFRPTPSRDELARTLANVLTHGSDLSWEGKILVVHRTTSPWADWPQREEFHEYAGWPLNLEDFYLKQALEVLGWRITQIVADDQVTLRIDFGASTYPKPDLMEEWYRDLPYAIRQKMDTGFPTEGDRRTNLIAAFASVYKNKIGCIVGLHPQPAEESFLEEIQTLRAALQEADLMEAALQKGIESGAFAMEEFYRGFWRTDPARGRADYEKWESQIPQARKIYDEALQDARRELWEAFESLQGQMNAMKRELIRRIRSEAEALGLAQWTDAEMTRLKMNFLQVFQVRNTSFNIAQWMDPEVKRLKPAAGALGDLNKKLFKAGILEEPMRVAVSSFLHDKAIRDLDLLEMYAFSIREGEIDRLEKILRHFSPLPAGIESLLERMADDFCARGAARGVKVDSGCVEPVKGRRTQLAESVALELVKGILANLIENGIKYSDPQNPRRNVVLIYNGHENVLEYRDNGIGMEPAFAARLGSEPGLRELDRVGDVKGTGTGWPIIVHNLQALGWSYEIETAPGQGLKVRIHIPPEHLATAV